MSLVLWMLLRTILYSIIGNTIYKWFARTKMGIWFDKKVSNFLTKITGKVEHLEILDDNSYYNIYKYHLKIANFLMLN